MAVVRQKVFHVTVGERIPISMTICGPGQVCWTRLIIQFLVSTVGGGSGGGEAGRSPDYDTVDRWSNLQCRQLMIQDNCQLKATKN